MRRFRIFATAMSIGCVICCAVLFSTALFGSLPGKQEKTKAPILRWSEQQPGCTFSRGDDGKYRYGLWSGDAGVILAVDAREVQIIRHRIEPIFGVWLTIRYRGAASLDETPEGITLQFMKHFKVEQPALDPTTRSSPCLATRDASYRNFLITSPSGGRIGRPFSSLPAIVGSIFRCSPLISTTPGSGYSPTA